MGWIVKHPRLVLTVTLVITVIFAVLLPTIVINNSVKVFFPDEHPSNLMLQQLDETYGDQILMVVSLTVDQGTILEPRIISHVDTLTRKIENFEFVEDVTSLTTTDFPEGTAEGMEVGPLVPEDFSGAPGESAAVQKRLLSWPAMYRNVLYNDDFSATQIVVSVDYDADAHDLGVLYNRIQGLLSDDGLSDVSYRLAGDPVITERAKEYMYRDLGALIPVVLLVIVAVLFVAFRRLQGTLIPVITVSIATVWTLGIMALTGVEFTIISTCLPVLLIAVGSAYGIHVLNHYYAELKEAPQGSDHTELVRQSVTRVIKPVSLAGITTVAGFLSILTSQIVPLKEFAIFSSLGTVFSLLLALTFIPALLVLQGPRDGNHREDAEKNLQHERRTRFYLRIFGYLRVRKPALLLATLVIIGLSIFGLTRINIESSLIKYFPRNSTMRVDNDYIADTFSGTNLFSLVVKGKKPGDLTHPEILKAMDDLSAYLTERHPEIGKIVSYTDFIRRMNRIMNYPPAEVAAADTPTAEPASAADATRASDDTGSAGFASFFDEPGASEDSSVSSFFDDASSGEAAGAVVSPAAQGTQNSPYRYEEYGKTMSYRDFLSLMHEASLKRGRADLTSEELLTGIERIFNYRGAAFDEIPYDPQKYPVETRAELANLISQYLLLYSGSLDKFADDSLEPTEARMQVQLRTHATGSVDQVIRDAAAYAEEHFPEGYSLEWGGTGEMELALTKMITGSQITSLIAALAVVFLIVALAFRSPVAGLIGCVPLGLAILINFGIMGLAGINLDMITALIASIAIGIGVDYTIHFLTNYHAERLKSDDLVQVTQNALLLSGQAILINAVSVGLGFAVLLFSGFVVLRYIGLLVAIIMGTSSLAALILLPILLNTLRPAFISRRTSAD